MSRLKILIIFLSAVLILSGCATYTSSQGMEHLDLPRYSDLPETRISAINAEAERAAEEARLEAEARAKAEGRQGLQLKQRPKLNVLKPNALLRRHALKPRQRLRQRGSKQSAWRKKHA